LAYILKLLDQYKDFDALHWFDAVNIKYEQELAAVLSEQKVAKKEVQTLTINKIRTYKSEFELLRYSFSSARIFFKD